MTKQIQLYLDRLAVFVEYKNHQGFYYNQETVVRPQAYFNCSDDPVSSVISTVHHILYC